MNLRGLKDLEQVVRNVDKILRVGLTKNPTTDIGKDDFLVDFSSWYLLHLHRLCSKVGGSKSPSNMPSTARFALKISLRMIVF